MRGHGWWRSVGWAFFLAAGLASSGMAQEKLPLPQFGPDKHLGVASCASAQCHGRVEPLADGVVLQNEVATFEYLDKHRKAYELLGNDLSRSMARKLGIGDARKAKICLDCHTDNVTADLRGEKFQIDDGVGCEACHGGSQRWIQIHAINDNAKGHARNVEAGLYPTEDPKARAELCLSCHLGNETKFVDHRIMGAGHPRLTFELDLFTASQPAHFVVDNDYRQRKRVVDGAQTWAIGQAIALARTLDGVLDEKRGRSGLFPELVFFDCHACHKPMTANRWQERASLNLGPGVVRFNDANLIMLRVITTVVDPALGKKVAAQGRALHQASQKGQQEWIDAATALRQTAVEAIDKLAAKEFGQRTLRATLEALVKEGDKGEYVDYVAAYQTTMAIEVISTAMRQAGWLRPEEDARVTKVKDALFEAVKNDELYRPADHLKALRTLTAARR